MSIIVRPDIPVGSAGFITTAAACAAAEAVEELCGHRADIKWVNDIWMNGRKICGILTEASLGLEMVSLDYAVIGIGVDVLAAPESISGELADTVTSIEAETGRRISRNALCAEIIKRTGKYLAMTGSREFLAEYRRRELLTGHEITASVGNEKLSGFAEGIDDNVNLILRLPDGSIRHLSSGEANLCRIK